MEPRLLLEAELSRPVVPAGTELPDPVYALIRLRPNLAGAARPRLDLTFLLDASASMFHFRMDPDQRTRWLEVARARGDVQEKLVDGRTSVVWGGQTLREIRDQISTPMHCALRGLWKGLQALAADDPVSVIAFADDATVVLDDPGQPSLEVRLPAAQRSLEKLASGSAQSGVGNNTRLANALRVALQRAEQNPGGGVQRAILVSDGRIEDRDACLPLIEQAVERELVISTIGVGDEFDEEFLMRIADETRGRYHYSPSARDLEEALSQEFALMSAVVARNALLRIAPAQEVVFRELYQTRPEFSRFPVKWHDDGSTLYRLGSLSTTDEVQLAAAFALPTIPAAEVSLGTVTLSGQDPARGPELALACELRIAGSPEPEAEEYYNAAAMATVQRLEVFLEERHAQAARESGDLESATRHLQSATRMLRKLGDHALAAEMEAEAAGLGAAGGDQSRTKRIKMGTRRLAGQQEEAEPTGTRRIGGSAPAPEPSGTRRIGGSAPPAAEPESSGTRRIGGGPAPVEDQPGTRRLGGPAPAAEPQTPGTRRIGPGQDNEA